MSQCYLLSTLTYAKSNKVLLFPDWMCVSFLSCFFSNECGSNVPIPTSDTAITLEVTSVSILLQHRPVRTAECGPGGKTQIQPLSLCAKFLNAAIWIFACSLSFLGCWLHFLSGSFPDTLCYSAKDRKVTTRLRRTMTSSTTKLHAQMIPFRWDSHLRFTLNANDQQCIGTYTTHTATRVVFSLGNPSNGSPSPAIPFLVFWTLPTIPSISSEDLQLLPREVHQAMHCMRCHYEQCLQWETCVLVVPQKWGRWEVLFFFFFTIRHPVWCTKSPGRINFMILGRTVQDAGELRG